MKFNIPMSSSLTWARHQWSNGASAKHPPLVPSVAAAASLERSRLTSLRLRRRRLSLTALFEECVEMMGPFVRGRGQNLTIAIAATPMELDADAEKLCQVLRHLVLNAVKHGSAGAEVEVTAVRDGDEAVISVVDAGIGIDERRIDSIFLPYAERHATASLRRGELGLGLHVARAFVEAHGGNLGASSDGAGHGSRFTLRLPCVTTTPPESVPAQPVPSKRSDSDLTAK